MGDTIVLSIYNIILLSATALGFLLVALDVMAITFDSYQEERRAEAIYNSHVEAR